MTQTQLSVKTPVHAPSLIRTSSIPLVPMPQTIKNVADLLVVVDAWQELPNQTRRILKANIRTAGLVALRSKARSEGRSAPSIRDDAILAAAPLSIRWLNDYLFAYSATLSGTTESCRNNSVSGLRRVLRRVGLIDPQTPSTMLPQDSAWRHLLDAVADAYCQTALATFGMWCHSAGIAPDEVSGSTLAAFEDHIRTRTLHSEIPRLVRGVCKAWPKAAGLLQYGAEFQLQPPSRREYYSYPLSDFPLSFQNDVALFRNRLSGTGRAGPFRGDGPRRTLRPSTIKTRLYNIRLAGSALILKGRAISTITTLADLVEEDAFEAILHFFWERGANSKRTLQPLQAGDEPDREAGVTSFTASIATTLMMIAKFHCKVDENGLRQIREMAQDVTPSPQTGLSPKNRERLRQFDDPATRAKLLHLPQRLAKLADSDKLRSLEAARLARLATALEILLHVPMRNGNLSGLKLGEHLRYNGARIQHIVLQPSETKNRYSGEWPVGRELAVTLDWYVTQFRPVLNPTGGDWLFPAGFGKSGCLSREAMSQQLVRVVAEEVGAIVNPHLFRCICARLILEANPEALEDVRLMIGEKSLQVVLTYYNASRPAHAALRTDNTLRRLRAESAMLATRPQKPKQGLRK